MIKCGALLCIRDHEVTDFPMEIVWSRDEEIRAADPPAGVTFGSTPFSIETREGELIGTCSLYNHEGIDKFSRCIQLGMRIGNKNYWNKGYGTEAVKLLLDIAYEEYNVTFVHLKVLSWNERAIRCYEKAGFTMINRFMLDGYEFVRMEHKR